MIRRINLKRSKGKEEEKMKIGQKLSALWQQAKEGLKSLGSMLGKVGHWLRGRMRWQKWTMSSGGVLLTTMITLLILHANGFVFDHKCQLPRVGSVHVLYGNTNPQKGLIGQIIWRVLQKKETPPRDSRYPWPTSASGTQLSFLRGEDITALCEVEYLHIVDCFKEVTWSDDPWYKSLYTLAECKVIRVLSQREDGMDAPIQEDDIITVFRTGNSTVQYYNTPPSV